jgi:hypothetical protein
LNFFKIRRDIRDLLFISGVTTPLISYSAVSTAPVKNLSPVSTIYISPVSLIPFRKKPKSLKFIASVIDTAEKLFTDVNDTADKLKLQSLGVKCIKLSSEQNI